LPTMPRGMTRGHPRAVGTLARMRHGSNLLIDIRAIPEESLTRPEEFRPKSSRPPRRIGDERDAAIGPVTLPAGGELSPWGGSETARASRRTEGHRRDARRVRHLRGSARTIDRRLDVTRRAGRDGLRETDP